MTVPSTLDAAGWLRNHLEDPDGDQDLARSMLQAFAEALMSAEASMQCQAAYGERSDERMNSRNGYRGAALGHAGRHDPAEHPEAARGQLLPAVAAGAPAPRRAGVGVGRRPGLRRRASRRGGWRISSRRWASPASRRRRCRGWPPSSTPRWPSSATGRSDVGPLPVSVDRRPDAEGARGRPGRQRVGSDRHGGQRGGSPGDRRVRHRHHRVHDGVDRVPALAGGPRPVAGSSWSSPTLTAASKPPSRRCWRRRRGSVAEPTSWPTWRRGCPKANWPMIATLVRSIFEQPDRDADLVAARRRRRPAHRGRVLRARQRRVGRRRRHLGVQRVPGRALAPDPLQQPAGTPEQGDPPAHRRRGHLPQPGRRDPSRRRPARRADRRVGRSPAATWAPRASPSPATTTPPRRTRDPRSRPPPADPSTPDCRRTGATTSVASVKRARPTTRID